MSPLTKSAAINLPAVALAACLGVLAVGCGGGGDTSTSNSELNKTKESIKTTDQKIAQLEKEKADLEKSGTATKEELAEKDTEIAKLKEQLADQPDDGDDDGDTPAPPTPAPPKPIHLVSITNDDQKSRIYNAIKLSVNEGISSGNSKGDYGAVVLDTLLLTSAIGRSATPAPGHVSVQAMQRPDPADDATETLIANLDIKVNGGDVSYKLDFHEGGNSFTTSTVKTKSSHPALIRQVAIANQLSTRVPQFSLAWNSNNKVTTGNMDPANFGFGKEYKTAVLKDENNPAHSIVGGAGATIYAEVYTDYDESADYGGVEGRDIDFRSGGVWIIIPDDAYVSRDDFYRFGTFAQGSHPFRGGIDVALEGKAIYNGKALGLHSYLEDNIRQVKRLTGDVTINVDFGTDSQNGTISGSINGLKLNGQATTGTNDSINLPVVKFVTPVNNEDIAAFGSTGNTGGKTHQSLGYINGIKHLGSWAGTFLGPADTSANNIHPKSIIGTATARGDGHPSAFGLSFVADRPE